MAKYDNQAQLRHLPTHALLHRVVYFLSFALATTTVAAASHALVARNHDIGMASDAAATQGVHLILSTNALTQPGYVLTSAASGVLVNSLILLFNTFKLPAFSRKHFILQPAFATFYFLFIFATSIVVTVRARTGHITIYATLGNIVLPPSIIEAQAAGLGLTFDFWGKGYVKFMAIGCWPATFFAFLTMLLAWQFFRELKATDSQTDAHLHGKLHDHSQTQTGGLDSVHEKPLAQHVEHA
ncbi:hypothetical protein P7C73_g1279, partial [Tremellales sp. Uapishka_1]